MTTETKKSAAITNQDASPRVQDTGGKGASFGPSVVDGYVTPSGSMAAGSTYLILRLKSTAVVKILVLESEAQGAGKFNVGVYYADSINDISAGNQANLGVAISAAFFASDVDCASAVVPTDITNESGTNTIDKRFMPLWQALGLSSDPGGKFDIVATVHTTDITTGGGKLLLRATFVDG